MEYPDTNARIAVLENEVKNIATDIRESRKESKEQHQAMMAKFECMDKRIGTIERWRWMVVGAGIAVGYLISHFIK